MNELILNDRLVSTDQPASQTLLDFVRYEKHLRGTKIGCREGDCGACTVLVGKLGSDGRVRYRSVTSCISPLGNAFGKHVVTIDGLRMGELSTVQNALVSEGASQCGFCTPGFAVSLTGFCLSKPGNDADIDDAIAAIDGNICRCTGYKSIERSAARIVDLLEGIANLEDLVAKNFLPEYFFKIPERLRSIRDPRPIKSSGSVIVGGGTDLYVQRCEELVGEPVQLLAEEEALSGISLKKNHCRIGAATTASGLLESPEMNRLLPRLREHLKLVSSTQIRNMGTIGGNLVNASPIGDLTIFFLALDASVILRKPDSTKRTLPLRELYLGYKKLAKEDDELVEAIEFPVPDKSTNFNFEKVSKRTHLDIASVNSALQITLSKGGEAIERAHLSAGGVGPVPAYLKNTADDLSGKELTPETIVGAAKTLATEISPISDARGSAQYKSLLLRQLFFAHFLEMYPGRFQLSHLI